MMKKRIISLLLTVAMLISALPIIANAETVDSEPSIKSTSLTLKGVLELNVKVDSCSNDMSGYKVVASIDGASQECTFDSNNGSLYVYKAKIPAHKLNETVTIQLLNANSEVIETKEWTLDAYLDYQVDRDPGLSDLAYALGLYADNAEAYKTGADSTPPETAVDQAMLEDHKCQLETSGDVIPSAVLLLNDAATLRVQMNEALMEKPALFDMNLGALEELPSTWTHFNNGSVQENVNAWSAENGVITCSVSSNPQVLRFGTIDEENYEITTNIVMQSAGSLGLVFADNQYFRIWWNGSKFGVIAGWYKTTGGPYRYLDYYEGYASSTCPKVSGLNAGDDATLKLKVEGNMFTISVNDQSWTIDAGKPLTGQFGLFQQGASGVGFGFKDVKAETIGTQDDESYGLKINGNAVTLTHDEAKQIYYYDIENIRVQDWGTKYAVEIVDSDSETLFACNYGVLSYVYTVLGAPERYPDELNLLKSMFLYYQGTVNYANGELFDYTLTYNANYEGSEETKVESVSGITATAKNFTVADNIFERPGYKFTGWNTKADGTGTSYAVGDTVALSAAKTLLSDEFNAISDIWTPYLNGVAAQTITWVAESGVVQDTNQSRGNNDVSVLMHDTAINADNYEITVDLVTPKVNYAIGLVFADNLHFRIWNNGSGYFTLYAGAYTGTVNNNLFSKSIGGTSGTKVTITLKVEGNKFSIYRNNEETALAEITTDKANLHGKIGLLVRSSSYDEKACFGNIQVLTAAKMTETLYAQWEELPLFSQNLGTLEELPSTWTHLNNGSAQADVSAWSAEDGVMTCSVSSNPQVLRFGTIDEENYEITANVVMQATGSLGLVFADNQYFRIWWNGSQFGVIAGWYKTTGGPYRYLDYYEGYASSTCPKVSGLNTGDDATLKLKVEGNTFTISVNDRSWTIVADKALTGQFGLFQQGATGEGFGFKDITVVKPVANAG